MSAHQQDGTGLGPEPQDGLDAEDIDEEVQDTGDAPMEDADDGDDPQFIQEIQLENDSAAHFDAHIDSIFCIAQHPTNPNIVVTGGGDDLAYVWNCTPAANPLLPASYQTSSTSQGREGLVPIATLDNHTDSVNAVTFTYPQGRFVVTAGLDGRVNVFKSPETQSHEQLLCSAQEVQEINWLAPCPYPASPDTFALGASDGSVWVYRINTDESSSLEIVQVFSLHTAPCTAGVWTPDGKLLVTVSEDSSLHVWDVFGEAQAAGIGQGQAIVSLGATDERFFVEGGLYCLAISPGGGIVAAGGAEGHIRVVGLPRLSLPATSAKGSGPGQAAGTGQGGQILASLQVQSDGVESLSFSQPPLTLLAAGSVDGSIALFDVAHNFAVRRHIKEAHEEEAVIKVDFVKTKDNERSWLLTSCGNDGVVRRWDVRGGTTAAAQGLVGEWKGHRGGGEGGGILGFVHGGDGKRIITAGDDGVALVFEES